MAGGPGEAARKLPPPGSCCRRLGRSAAWPPPLGSAANTLVVEACCRHPAGIPHKHAARGAHTRTHTRAHTHTHTCGRAFHPPCNALQVQRLSLASNQLTGPAFPPAWLEPGSLPSLSALFLSGNVGLTGTLPASLPWPNLQSL